jgi:hypothetical protein
VDVLACGTLAIVSKLLASRPNLRTRRTPDRPPIASVIPAESFPRAAASLRVTTGPLGQVCKLLNSSS